MRGCMRYYKSLRTGQLLTRSQAFIVSLLCYAYILKISGKRIKNLVFFFVQLCIVELEQIKWFVHAFRDMLLEDRRGAHYAEFALYACFVVFPCPLKCLIFSQFVLKYALSGDI